MAEVQQKQDEDLVWVRQEKHGIVMWQHLGAHKQSYMNNWSYYYPLWYKENLPLKMFVTVVYECHSHHWLLQCLWILSSLICECENEYACISKKINNNQKRLKSGKSLRILLCWFQMHELSEVLNIIRIFRDRDTLGRWNVESAI